MRANQTDSYTTGMADTTFIVSTLTVQTRWRSSMTRSLWSAKGDVGGEEFVEALGLRKRRGE